ncbi:MAG: hypothetical protein K8U03_26790 [Planctomycetia bacterium]|nr:hypothetical protein [Planctomycetia bacterium]
MPIINGAAPFFRSRILHLPEALRQSPTKNVVLGIRVSELSQIKNGSLFRQQCAARRAIREAGGRLVAIVGNDKPYQGRISTGRPDLYRAVAHALRHKAIICYPDIGRLLRPEASNGGCDPFTEPSGEDFDLLGQIVSTVVVAVVESPSASLQELHGRKTSRGIQNAIFEGRPPGPKPRNVTRRQDVAIRYLRNNGETFSSIGSIVGLSASEVRRHLFRKP